MGMSSMGQKSSGPIIKYFDKKLSPTPPHKINASDVVTLHWLSFQDGGQKVSEQRRGRNVLISFFVEG